MRTRASVPIISILTGAALLAVILVLRMAPAGTGATDVVAALPAEDVARLGVEVKPVDATGLISRDEALAAAAKQFDPSAAAPEAYLQLMTDPTTARGDAIVDRPMWVVRYSGLTVMSPGDVELHYAYVLIDARTGVEHHTTWSP